MTIVVSACLLGVGCRYDGESKPHDAVLALLGRHTLIPVCGEAMGGLPTPRIPSERRGDRVINAAGQDVTAELLRQNGVTVYGESQVPDLVEKGIL